MKKRVWHLLITVGLWCVTLAMCLAANIQAASFDCDQATLKVEKIVCENQFLSGLDDKLGVVYKTVFEKANNQEKKELLTQQRHWLKHTRNICETEVCFKHAYWSRQAELSNFFQLKVPLFAKESDKVEGIRKVLATAPLYPSTQSDQPLCRQLLADLKEMSGIRFIEPVVKATSYEDPALDPWKQRFCKPEETCRPFNFNYSCEPRMSEGEDIDTHLQDCAASNGLPPYKMFELPPLTSSSKPRFFFYFDQSYGPLNQEWKKASITPSPEFHQIGPEACSGFVACGSTSGTESQEEPNYNSIIEYKQRYFIMHLEYSIRSYWLSISPVDKNEVCRWTPVKK